MFNTPLGFDSPTANQSDDGVDIGKERVEKNGLFRHGKAVMSAACLVMVALVFAPISVAAWALGYWQGGQYVMRLLRR